MRSMQNIKLSASTVGSNNPTTTYGDKHKTFATHMSPMPKHIQFPDYSSSSELLNELVTCLFNVTAATMQFLNIYRTNWWMADSYVQHKINLHLIDIRLVFLILLITTRRLLYCLLHHIVSICENKRSMPSKYRSTLKYVFGIIWLILFLACSITISRDHSTLLFLFLCYPAIVYFLIFGLCFEPFFRTSFEIDGAYFNGMPFHSCSTNPTDIREEIDTLKSDFNKRFKQVIYTSMVNAYYTGFVPCFFAFSVSYNFLWIGLNIVLIWISSFMMSTIFVFPAKYCDILHRASLHLGLWQKLNVNQSDDSGAATTTKSAMRATTTTADIVTINWNKNIVWPADNIIKYNNVFYRSCGPCTVATPGNASNARFYQLFHNPEQIYLILTYVQATLILAQILILFFAIEWHFILSITFVAFTNQFIFFKILRDYLITKKIYGAESAIAEKHLD